MNDGMLQPLTVAFAAGFVVQRALEIIDPVSSKILSDPIAKKAVMAVVSLLLGWGISVLVPIEIFHQLLKQGSQTALPDGLDSFLSGIFISAGTEGFNSLMKFAQYKKEASKAEAAAKLSSTDVGALKKLNS